MAFFPFYTQNAYFHEHFLILVHSFTNNSKNEKLVIYVFTSNVNCVQ